jgi:PKD repeat protein
MNKFRVTYLGAFILGWLLAFGSHAAWGYYPPLQATAEYDTHTVTYTVYNPEKQQGYVASHSYPPTITVVNLQQHNGVIAWVTQDGATYSVSCVTFDPALNTFQNAYWGPFPSLVSHFQVLDGVVAFSIIDSSGNVRCEAATYDPAKEAWQKSSISISGIFSLGIINKDGVVVWRYYSPVSGDYAFIAKLYDPKLGIWTNGYIFWSYGEPITTLYVSNATVYYQLESWGYESFIGYNLGHGYWTDQITTPPTAYFVAQPKLGSSPLWVWFTDMSIAGANWSWDFGDTFLVIGRSLYYSFTAPGSYQVTQWISGPSTYSQTIIVGYPSTLKGKSLPAILYLLLAD